MMEECGNHANNFSLPLVMVVVLCFMVFNTTFNNISVILWRLGLFHWWRKPEYPEKTADLS